MQGALRRVRRGECLENQTLEMIQRLPTIVPVFFLGIVVFVSGCSPPSPAERQTDRPFEIVQTRFFGSLWNRSQARASIVSQDGGESFIVPGGAIWAFGDTFKGSRSAEGVPQFAGGAVSCTIAFLADSAKTYPPALDYLVSSNGAVSPFEFLPDETPTGRHRI